MTQDTQEATVGILGSAITIKGLTLVSNIATGKATLTCPNNTACFQTIWNGLAVSDQFGFLGAGTTIDVSGVDPSGTFATLSRNALNGASATNLTVSVNTVRSVTGTLTGNPPGTATVQNTVPPSTTSAVATLTCSSACFNASDVGLDVSDGNVHLSPGTVIVAVSGLVGGMYTTATLSRNVKDTLPFTGSDTIVVGPPHGYCRPSGSAPSPSACPPSRARRRLAAASRTLQRRNRRARRSRAPGVRAGGDRAPAPLSLARQRPRAEEPRRAASRAGPRRMGRREQPAPRPAGRRHGRDAPATPPNAIPVSLEEAGLAALRAALEAENGNLTKVAQRLGISRPTLYRKLDHFGIRRTFA